MIDVLEKDESLGYLGREFQLKTIWQIIYDDEFGYDVVPNLEAKYFDDHPIRKLFILIKNYYNQYNSVPKLKNNTLIDLINAEYKNEKDKIDKEILLKISENIKEYELGVIEDRFTDSSKFIQDHIWQFIKQQELKKVASSIVKNLEEGRLHGESISTIEENFKKIQNIGSKEDLGKDVLDEIDDVLSDEYRNPVSTSIEGLDAVLQGGGSRQELLLIIGGSGIGKSTILSKISNSAYNRGNNVLQIIFEDKYKEIQRKHYTLWSGIPLSELKYNKDEVRNHVLKNIDKKNKLILMKFPQDATIPHIRHWIENYQKKSGIKFDLIALDYLDCVQPHIRTNDVNENEKLVIQDFEQLIIDFDCVGWTAVQANRSGLSNNVSVVETNQIQGSIKKAQKSHFIMSIARSLEQKENKRANIAILKSRFGRDGMVYKDCVFDNDKIDIRFDSEGDIAKELLKGDGEKKDLPEIPFVSSLSDLNDDSDNINIEM